MRGRQPVNLRAVQSGAVGPDAAAFVRATLPKHGARLTARTLVRELAAASERTGDDEFLGLRGPAETPGASEQ